MPGFQLVKRKSDKVSIGSLSLVIGLVIANAGSMPSHQIFLDFVRIQAGHT